MREEAEKHGSPAPVFEATRFFTAIFRPLATAAEHVTASVEAQVAGEVRRLLEVLAAKGPMARAQAQSGLGLKGQANFRDRYARPALAAGLIEMTIPDKPRSSKQRYRITPLGIAAVRKHRKEP